MPFCLISSSAARSPFPSYLRQPYTTEILDFLTGIKIFYFFCLRVPLRDGRMNVFFVRRGRYCVFLGVFARVQTRAPFS